jgi:hypothetical protein
MLSLGLSRQILKLLLKLTNKLAVVFEFSD